MESDSIINKIKEITNDEETKHIGYGALSLVYYVPKTNSIIKCFEISDETDVEIKLYKKMKKTRENFPNQIERLSIPNEIFYMKHNKKKYCCLEIPCYESDLKKFDIKNCSIEQKKIFINQLRQGVFEMHLMGYYHGDLKKENICISSGEDGKKEIKIIDFGLSDKTENEIMEYRLKNTFKDASPIQVLNHLGRFIRTCPFDDKENKCTCKEDKEVMKRLIKSLEKNGVKLYANTLHETDIIVKEKCMINDMFIVGCLIYYIITGETFFNESIDEMIEETIEFLENPEKFVDEKINKYKDETNEGVFNIFKLTIMGYIKNIKEFTKIYKN